MIRLIKAESILIQNYCFISSAYMVQLSSLFRLFKGPYIFAEYPVKQGFSLNSKELNNTQIV